MHHYLPRRALCSPCHSSKRNIRTHAAKTIFDGAISIDLLIYVAMISSLLTIGILWHAIQTFPGFLETVGYLFGMLGALFTLESYWWSDIE